MARFVKSLDASPVFSNAKAAKIADIPPYTLGGPAYQSQSPIWSPRTNILLTSGYVQARTQGTVALGVVLEKWSSLAESPETLGSAILQANQMKVTFEFQNSTVPKIITPTDKVYVLFLSNSQHEDTVVQMLGEII